MRISKQKAAEHRALVLEQASRMFCERGLDGASVAELMKAAGLTHGGFYNHFGSKTELQADALALTFEQAVARLTSVNATEPAARGEALARYVERYLSDRSRDAAGASCPMVAFGADVSREDTKVQEAYATGIERYIAELATALRDTAVLSAEEGRRRALTLLAGLVGGLSLARSVAPMDQALSDEILETVRNELLTALRDRLGGMGPSS